MMGVVAITLSMEVVHVAIFGELCAKRFNQVVQLREVHFIVLKSGFSGAELKC